MWLASGIVITVTSALPEPDMQFRKTAALRFTGTNLSLAPQMARTGHFTCG